MARGVWALRHWIPMGRAFTLGLLTIALVAGLLSDIDSFWKIGLAAVLGGVIVGGLMVWRGREPEESLESNPLGDARIDSSKIPIRVSESSNCRFGRLQADSIPEILPAHARARPSDLQQSLRQELQQAQSSKTSRCPI